LRLWRCRPAHLRPISDCRLPPLPAQSSCSALRSRFEPALVTILRTSAADASSMSSSGSASHQFQLAPSPNCSASPSAPSSACTADWTSNSAVLFVG
jgi:hypothetical protein